MKISPEKLAEIISETVKETVGLDYSNRGQQEPIGKHGAPVVEGPKEIGLDSDERVLASDMMKVVEKYIDKKKMRYPAGPSKKKGEMKWVLEDIDEIVMQSALRIIRTLNRKQPTKRAAGWNVGDPEFMDKGQKYSYTEVKDAVREALNEGENNPFAICTASVGREDKEKYERCVQDVKKETGYKD